MNRTKIEKFTTLKKVVNGGTLLLCCVLLFQSCTKNEVNDPDPDPIQNTLVFSPDPVLMGAAPVDNDVKLKRSVILFNSGNQTVHVSDYSISGTDAADFKIINNPAKSIDPVESVVIELELNPSKSGQVLAELKVESEQGSLTNEISGLGTSGSDKIEFLRINSVQDQEKLSYGIETNDGGLIFIGTNLVKSTIEHTDVKVLKTDKFGAKVWEKTYGGEYSESPARIVQIADGGYVVGGTTESFNAKNTDMYLFKIDDQGNELWHKTFGGDPYESINRIVPVTDGGFLLFGTTREFQSDVLIIKVDADGSSQWEKTIGGEGGENVGDVLVKEDGQGYLFVGRTTSHDPKHEDTDVWLVEIDDLGNVISENRFGSSLYDTGNGLIKLNDGSFIISGTTLSNDKARQAYLLKLNADYTVAWEKTFGGDNNDSFGQVQENSAGDLLVIGNAVREVTTEHTYSDALLYKIDASGNQKSVETFTGSKSVGLSSLEPTSDGGFIIGGGSDSYSLNEASLIVKISTTF